MHHFAGMILHCQVNLAPHYLEINQITIGFGFFYPNSFPYIPTTHYSSLSVVTCFYTGQMFGSLRKVKYMIETLRWTINRLIISYFPLTFHLIRGIEDVILYIKDNTNKSPKTKRPTITQIRLKLVLHKKLQFLCITFIFHRSTVKSP